MTSEQKLIDVILWPGRRASWIVIKTILFKQGITDAVFVLDYTYETKWQNCEIPHHLFFSVHNPLMLPGNDILNEVQVHTGIKHADAKSMGILN